MEFVKRKQSLEEEISLCEFILTHEYRVDMKQRIQAYMDQINGELLSLLR
jgi:hypothetical protein